MKAFTIVYARTVRGDKVIQARNEKEARAKFQKEHPEVQVLDIQDWHEGVETIYE